jgi:hypothetical protein
MVREERPGGLPFPDCPLPLDERHLPRRTHWSWTWAESRSCYPEHGLFPQKERSAGGHHMGQGARWHFGQRQGRFSRGKRGREGGDGYPVASLAYLKPKISERFHKAKDAWHANPTHHGTEETDPPPPSKKSCLDHMLNSLARTAAQIRTGHWRSAVCVPQEDPEESGRSVLVLQRVGQLEDDHVLLYCLRATRVETWDPGGVRVLLANPRWERRFVKFLELSGLGE